MRAFVVLREFALTNADLNKKLKEIETRFDRQFKDVYEAINFLLTKENNRRFRINGKKSASISKGLKEIQ
jgi:hypothetical protein